MIVYVFVFLVKWAVQSSCDLQSLSWLSGDPTPVRISTQSCGRVTSLHRAQ